MHRPDGSHALAQLEIPAARPLQWAVNGGNLQGTAQSTTLIVCNEKGLHARASAKFVKCAERFDCAITVSRDGQSVCATSIMGLMMLAAGPGAEIRIEARGPDSKEAIEALGQLVRGGFDEDR